MKGLALAVVGLWTILQTTYGPLATKLGLIAGLTSSSDSSANTGGGAGSHSSDGSQAGGVQPPPTSSVPGIPAPAQKGIH